jgi:hypothetical protein
VELYIAPPEADPDVTLTRGAVLDALGAAGLVVEAQEERSVSGTERLFWSLRLSGGDAHLVFQEQGGRLLFATLEQSMFDNSTVPTAACRALEGLGWQVDEENVG